MDLINKIIDWYKQWREEHHFNKLNNEYRKQIVKKVKSGATAKMLIDVPCPICGAPTMLDFHHDGHAFVACCSYYFTKYDTFPAEEALHVHQMINDLPPPPGWEQYKDNKRMGGWLD